MSATGVVYVVDDDASFRKAVTRMLTAAGLNVQCYSSGTELLAHLSDDSAEEAGCVLADLCMPGLDGLQLQEACAQAVLLGALPLPFLVTPAFLITILVMAVELSRGFLLTRQTRQELEELRSELARAGRVTALGQLASALAHELSQPLSAILRNAEAAEIHLSNPNPDLDELREIGKPMPRPPDLVV